MVSISVVNFFWTLNGFDWGQEVADSFCTILSNFWINFYLEFLIEISFIYHGFVLIGIVGVKEVNTLRVPQFPKPP